MTKRSAAGMAETQTAADGDAGPAAPAGGAGGRLKRWLPLLLLLGLSAVAFALGWHRYLGLSSLISHRATLGAMVADNLLLAAAVYCLVYIAAVALSFPGASLLTLVAGLLFGALLGGTLTVFAATIGATIIFLVARSSLGCALQDKAGPMTAKVARGLREDAFSYLMFLRLTPIFPFWLVNVAPALVSVRLRTYVAATFLGIVPGTYAYAFVGAGLDSLIAAQERADPGCAAEARCTIDVSALLTREMLLGFAALGAVSLLPVLVKAWRRRRGSADS